MRYVPLFKEVVIRLIWYELPFGKPMLYFSHFLFSSMVLITIAFKIYSKILPAIEVTLMGLQLSGSLPGYRHYIYYSLIIRYHPQLVRADLGEEGGEVVQLHPPPPLIPALPKD